jgi:hypothetical protein
MSASVHEAPKFSRRVCNADELAQAIPEAIRAAGIPGSDIDFNGVVRLEQDEPKDGKPGVFILTIIKRA